MEPPPDPPVPELDDPVPIMRTWPRMYAAAIVSAVLVMVLIAVFSRWAF